MKFIYKFATWCLNHLQVKKHVERAYRGPAWWRVLISGMGVRWDECGIMFYHHCRLQSVLKQYLIFKNVSKVHAFVCAFLKLQNIWSIQYFIKLFQQFCEFFSKSTELQNIESIYLIIYRSAVWQHLQSDHLRQFYKWIL